MHSAIQFFACWGLAFVTLAVALVLLNIYYAWIGNDLVLRSFGQEAALAAGASLIEGASAWAVMMFVPGAARAMFFPAVLVAIIYKCAHLEDWSRWDILLLFLFQVVLGSSVGFVYAGHVRSAVIIVAVFGAFLGILGSFTKDL